MTEHKTLAAALAAVQGDMPSVHKGKTANVGQYRYTYADLADVSSAILPLLAENGLAFTCHPRRVEGGNTYELAATLLHTSGETIEGALPISGNQPQQIGSAITYGRRYLLGCLTGIVTDDDDDGQVHQRVTQQQKQTQQLREAKRETRQPQWAKEDLVEFAQSAARIQPEGEQLEKANRRDGVTPAQLKAIGAGMSGMSRDTALTYVAQIVGRQVDSRNDLTRSEASRLIDALKADAADQGASELRGDARSEAV